MSNNTVLSDREKALKWYDDLLPHEWLDLQMKYEGTAHSAYSEARIIEYYHREHRKETSPTTTVKEGEEGFTKGEWEIRGNKIFVKGTYNSICQVHVKKNYEEVTFEPIQDVEAEANAHLIAASKELFHELKEILQWGSTKGGKFTFTTSIEKYNELEQLIKKANPKLQ